MIDQGMEARGSYDIIVVQRLFDERSIINAKPLKRDLAYDQSRPAVRGLNKVGRSKISTTLHLQLAYLGRAGFGTNASCSFPF